MITKCTVCGHKIKTIYTINNIDILGMENEYTHYIGVCEKCGLIYTQNPFDEIKLANRYKNESKYEYNSSNYVLNESSEYSVRCKMQKEFIDRSFGGNYNSVLEVGAASGYNLSLYKDVATVMGIEPSPLNGKLAKEIYGIDMFTGTYQEYFKECASDKYDLVYLSMVLEHIVNPFEFLQRIKEINNKYIFIEVPTLDTNFVNEPFGLFHEEHVNYYTLESLNNMMAELGYGLVDAQIQYGLERKNPSGWPAVDTLWETGRKKNNLKHVATSEELLERYIKKSEEEFKLVKEKIDAIPSDKRLAVWGTGHLVSMLLANTSLAEKNIVKFYDSDVRKHKYTMCGKPIEIFCEDDIYNHKVEAILIGTYTFQEELVSKVKPYTDLISIYKLYE